MSGRIGALNTAGRGWVEPEGLPSPEAMVTVGRVVMMKCDVKIVGVLELNLNYLSRGLRFCSAAMIVAAKPQALTPFWAEMDGVSAAQLLLDNVQKRSYYHS